MATNAVLLVIDIWLLGALVLLLHRYSDRIGLGPLLLIIGVLTVFVQSQLGVYVEALPGVTLFLSSNVLVPIILMVVLVVYICNGAKTARIVIFSVLGASLLVLLIHTAYRLHVLLPGGGLLSLLDPEQAYAPLNLRVTVASLVAFACDLFVIAIFYQGARNYAPRLPEWVVVGIALLAGVWTDALVFTLIADLGSPDFATLLASAVLGKLFSVIVLWPLLAYYIVFQAPKVKGYRGSANRGTLDLIFGSYGELEQALSETQSELKKVETQRQQEEVYFQQIAENISEALWLLEPQRQQVFYLNSAYAVIWGRSVEDIFADPFAFANSLHPDDRDRILSGLYKQLSGFYEAEYRIVRPNGDVRWVRDRAFPIRDSEGKVYRIAGITEDITERIELEKKRLDLALERDKVRLLRDFVSEVSHDLKSPLSSIHLKAHLIRHLDDAQARAAQLDELDSLVVRMNRMIDDLFTIAQLDSMDESDFEAVNLDDLVRETCKSYQSMAQGKNLDFVLELNSGSAAILANKQDMTRVLENLLENAFRYTESGTVTVTTDVVDDTEVMIRVSDTGIGIAEADQPQIFNRFYRAANGRSAEPMGTGLGLTIVKKFVDNHHGRVEVESALGSGTTFTVYLPRA